MVVSRLVRFLLFRFQIYDIACLQREVFGHLVEFHQLLGLASHASGDLVETVVILSVYIDQTVGTIDLIDVYKRQLVNPPAFYALGLAGKLCLRSLRRINAIRSL